MSREIAIGSKKIGGGKPVLVQSMCNTMTSDVKATVAQIHELEKAGCELIRVAVPDEKSAQALGEIKKRIDIPLIADIHFDYRLAILSAKHADKLRINPGNIGSEENIKKIIAEAKKYDIPIRIGVNLGSLEKSIEKELGRTPEALVSSAMKYIKFFEKNDFHKLVISIKASDVKTTIVANRLLSKETDYPIHLGITEAGTCFDGTIKSAIGIGSLLGDGIGDTIRVSLTEDPVDEIPVAYSILKALGLRNGRKIISCPTCGRTHGDLIRITKEIEELTKGLDKDITIAVMGCEVNGPGEASNADVGVALGKTHSLIFRKGKVVKKISQKSIITGLMDEVDAA